MGVQAQWHGDMTVAQQQGDVFAEVRPPRAPVDAQQRLGELIDAEGRLFLRGVSCPIRERADTCCSACPVYGDDPAIAELCRVGREQERICTTQAAEQHGATAS